MSEKINQVKPKEKVTFNMIWQKYGTFGILVILLILLAVMKPGIFFSTDTSHDAEFSEFGNPRYTTHY